MVGNREEVIEQVKRYFERRRVDCSQLKIESVRDALKELHLQAHYEDSAMILFKVNGKCLLLKKICIHWSRLITLLLILPCCNCVLGMRSTF